MRFFLALVPTLALVLYGQLMLKWRIGYLMKTGALGSTTSERLWAYLHDPFVISGYASAFFSSLAWMLVIEKYPLSQAFPVYIGLTFCFVTLGSALVLGEQITPMRILAILLIVAGVAVGSQA